MKTFDDFKAAFPHLYSNVRCGFQCPPGWLELVWKLSEQIEPLGAECDQVKEKFGTLRFYLRREVKTASRLVSHAEDESATTCQECGKPGKLGKSSPFCFATLCPEHTPSDVDQDVPDILQGGEFAWPGVPEKEGKP